MSPNFWVYLILRLLTGISNGGLGLSSFVLATEAVGPSKRAPVGMSTFYFFSLGIAVLPALSYFSGNWRYLYVASSIPSAPVAISTGLCIAISQGGIGLFGCIVVVGYIGSVGYTCLVGSNGLTGRAHWVGCVDLVGSVCLVGSIGLVGCIRLVGCSGCLGCTGFVGCYGVKLVYWIRLSCLARLIENR